MQYNELIKNVRILLADDDEDYLLMTSSFLKQVGYNIDCVSDGSKAIESLKTGKYQIALLDYFMPGFNGEEVIEEIRKYDKELIIILQTGFSGQNPPIETMHKLNIQNYFDKTEGIDRLNLEITSAVKIFNQQSEIEMAKYKTNIVGYLINNIAQEVKSDLLSINAGVEVTNMILSNDDVIANVNDIKKLREICENSKFSFERIDTILDAIIAETKGEEKILTCDDITLLINIITRNEARKKEIKFNINTSIKSSEYISGNVLQAVFISCDLLKKIIDISDSSSNIEVVFTEDEQNWLFSISSQNISKLSKKDTFVLNRIASYIDDINIEFNQDCIDIIVKKNKN